MARHFGLMCERLRPSKDALSRVSGTTGLAEEFDGLRLIHGACTVQSMTAFSDEKKLVLDCEHGGEVELTMLVMP
jgi:hypothetical protein